MMANESISRVFVYAIDVSNGELERFSAPRSVLSAQHASDPRLQGQSAEQIKAWVLDAVSRRDGSISTMDPLFAPPVDGANDDALVLLIGYLGSLLDRDGHGEPKDAHVAVSFYRNSGSHVICELDASILEASTPPPGGYQAGSGFLETEDVFERVNPVIFARLGAARGRLATPDWRGAPGSIESAA
ncbi:MULTISPECIES: hypothetical protein [unclassified Thioalkalivibrio]|uniref:hypothetical protein n=1 Tax=unclassified Thioalkalivibrio TaxID=2621013 RepID=UPI000369093A|nr:MULTISPECIES: hypothetical protein [unclassified Thioalkalivibrio]